MATVTVNWTTQDEVIPDAAQFTQYSIQLLQNGSVLPQFDATEPLGSTQHVFFSVAAGDYVASAVLEKPDGTDSGTPMTAAFTVPAEPTAPVVASINVALS